MIKQLENAGYSSAVLKISTLHHENYQLIREQASSNFPIVSCSTITHPILSTVTFDAYEGGSLVASHFATRGYKTAGFIEGPTNNRGLNIEKMDLLIP